ncbi:uncharacterized protein LOC127105476 [Lathyrus oleraceus]|uniref:uncharacterized protein LOC127105476 n=1 Tax=Pisum sativum TaxID=3888 RepID=UPI0021D199B1|nr:uncharacterized protein LOC127105476 [Pisum sativum]
MKRANFIKYKGLKTNCYMKGENMIKVVKFVYTMIVFLFLVLAATNVEGWNPCEQDSDCPKDMCRRPKKALCVNNSVCICIMPAFHVSM